MTDDYTAVPEKAEPDFHEILCEGGKLARRFVNAGSKAFEEAMLKDIALLSPETD